MTNTTMADYREELISIYSDTYKDAYNVRPRGPFDHMSNIELNAAIERLSAQWQAQYAIEVEESSNAVNACIERIETNAQTYGITTREYLKWEFDGANLEFEVQSISSFIYNECYTFNDATRKLEEYLKTLIETN